LYHGMCFLSPGLFKTEKRLWCAAIALCVTSVYVGFGLAYSYVLPYACTFLQESHMDFFVFLPKLSAFNTLVFCIYFGTSVCVICPYMLCLCISFRWVCIDVVCTHRRLVYLVCIVCASLVSVPDVWVQASVSCFFVLICEFCMYVSCVWTCYMDMYS
jgi:sec-independent protein translocase protein TatC